MYTNFCFRCTISACSSPTLVLVRRKIHLSRWQSAFYVFQLNCDVVGIAQLIRADWLLNILVILYMRIWNIQTVLCRHTSLECMFDDVNTSVWALHHHPVAQLQPVDNVLPVYPNWMLLIRMPCNVCESAFFAHSFLRCSFFYPFVFRVLGTVACDVNIMSISIIFVYEHS